MHRYLDYILRDIEYYLARLRWRQPRCPVIIYQMGKVASTSVYQSLKRTTDCSIFHVHRLSPTNISNLSAKRKELGFDQLHEKLSLFFHQQLIERCQQPTRIISLVREPIGRNISAYFQNLSVFFDSPDAHQTVAVDQLVAEFLENYTHDVPLTWFDNEMRDTTKIDVFSEPFPQEQGFNVLHADPFHLLIMRHDLDDAKKQQCIREFLDDEQFTLSRHNEASAKSYSQSYKAFLKSITVPQSYAQQMLNSRYAEHFYGAAERERLFEKWTSPR